MMPLTLASVGENVRLVDIIGGQDLRKRLADLGFNQGMTLRIVQKDANGPLILAVKDSRMVLGRGMAQKVMVEIL